MKKERESRIRPRASALRTVFGARIVGSMAAGVGETEEEGHSTGQARSVLSASTELRYLMTARLVRQNSFWCEQQASGSKPVAKAHAVTIYGIKNCDTMKKARAWLDDHGVAYAFHDYKTQGIDRARLEAWAGIAGWETLLNRAGTTFRRLPEADKEGITEKKAIALMLAQPSLIKRPVLEAGRELLVGFKPDIYRKFLGG